MPDEKEDAKGGFSLEGLELKKLLKIARNQQLPFAFCPGAGEGGPSFGVHRRKKPEVMGKSMRKESGQSKVAFGQIKVDGKIASLTCTKLVPGMDKKLQKFFREQKLALTVKLLDVDGKELNG